jgi:hypothetical protein
MKRLALLAALLAASPAVAQEKGWQAGFGRSNITPDEFMWMSGYGARTTPADGKETDLWAKAAVLSPADGRSLVLVTLDLVGIDRDMGQRICGLIQAKHKVPRECIALAVSHTHCGPVVGSNLRSMYFLDEVQAKRVEDYTAKLPGKVLAAVDAAVADLGPVTLSRGTGTAGFAVNRRENKEAEVPALRAKGALKGPTDHEVPVLAARTADGRLKCVIFGYACHATVLSYQKWCGDYPGFAAMELEKAHPGATALFFAGCGADQNPLPRRTVDLARGYGKQLADAVTAVLTKPMTPVEPEFAATYREIELPLKEVPTREGLIKESTDANKFIAARAKMWLKKIDAGGSLPSSYPFPVQAWRLGRDQTVVILGGEVVVDYALRLKKELGPVWVVGYANDVMAYIPSARVLKESGYEGATSMIYYGLPSVWGPPVEEKIVAEVKRQAGEVKAAGPVQVPVFVAGEGGYHTYRIPAVIATPKGTVLAFCEGRKAGRGDAGNIDLILRRSTDGGKTWGPTQVVWDDGDNTCGNPCPVLDAKTGTVWLLMTHNLGKDTETKIVSGKSERGRTVWVTKSDDDGLTWDKPLEITKGVTKPGWTWYATGPGVGIQLRSGRLLIPCDSKSDGGKTRESHVITSDDGGKSWVLGGVVGPMCNECQAVELTDGAVMLNMRTYMGNNRRLVAVSNDGGATFTAPVEDKALIEPVCQASILRLPGPGGGIAFSNPASLKRENMTVRLSRDDGKTWPAARVLHPGPAAYSCLVALPSGEVGCLYERGEKNAYETITFARFTRDWLTDTK